MKGLRIHRSWAAINLLALLILVFTVTQVDRSWSNLETFDPSLESGKWAVRFLILCLVMTPLGTYFRWNEGLRLRKSFGLWSFGFACTHVAFTLLKTRFLWLQRPWSSFILLGLVSLGILSILALTSNRFAMRRLGKKMALFQAHLTPSINTSPTLT